MPSKDNYMHSLADLIMASKLSEEAMPLKKLEAEKEGYLERGILTPEDIIVCEQAAEKMFSGVTTDCREAIELVRSLFTDRQ